MNEHARALWCYLVQSGSTDEAAKAAARDRWGRDMGEL